MFGLGFRFPQLAAGGLSLEAQIRELFANGEQGAWYDPSDMATLFQDAAGTVPVTATGQPVGLILDKSGNGNHASQNTAPARPTYESDGELHWLYFDGVDNALATPAVTLGLEVSLGASVERESDDHGEIISGPGAGLVDNGTFRISVSYNASNPASYYFGARGASATGRYVGPFPVPSRAVLGLKIDFSGTRSPAFDATVNEAGFTREITYPDGFNTDSLYIGSTSAGSRFFKGKIFGIFACSTYLEPVDNEIVTRWLSNKAGV